MAVVEAARVGRGVTGCTTAKVSALQQTICSIISGRHGDEAAAVYAQGSLAAVDRLAALVVQEGIECDLERRPAYTYAADERELRSVEQEGQALRQAGLPAVMTDTPDLPYPVAGAVRLDDQVHLHPVRYARAWPQRCTAMGRW